MIKQVRERTMHCIYSINKLPYKPPYRFGSKGIADKQPELLAAQKLQKKSKRDLYSRQMKGFDEALSKRS
jgi:hypothetical protein